MKARERVLDVSDLPPPEPLQKALEAAENLAPGEYLRLIHRREPLLLYPQLEARGFCYRVRPGRTSAFEVLIWRQGDEVAARHG
ncbi:MAG: DUF2249 domain-containing protein [Gammaproteobacteria bacterium]|nr:MAG: DUF2249 domain-containing protein [Gammaproteobacteria bacterium]